MGKFCVYISDACDSSGIVIMSAAPFAYRYWFEAGL